MAKMTYTRAEVAAILVDLEADGRELYDIFTAPLCKECGQKKGPCPDGSPCWLDDLTVAALAEKWLDRREAAAVKGGGIEAREGVIVAIITGLIIVIAVALSWAVTVGIVWLICRLLGLAFFTVARATAIWLVLALPGSAFRVVVHKD